MIYDIIMEIQIIFLTYGMWRIYQAIKEIK